MTAQHPAGFPNGEGQLLTTATGPLEKVATDQSRHCLNDSRICALAQDQITLLTTTGNLLAAKRWNVDGTVDGEPNALNYSHRVVKVADIHALSALLTSIEGDSKTCLIRGRYIGDEAAVPLMKIEENWRAGLVLRRKDCFHDQALHTLMIDVDGFSPTVGDPLIETEACIDEYVRAKMPACFIDVSYHWQLSGKAGRAENAGVLKVHIWFWLKTPYSCADLAAWHLHASLGSSVDRALFREVQVHYTAAPVFAPGVVNPVARRSGFVEGMFGDEVDLVIDAKALAAGALAVASGTSAAQETRKAIDGDPVAQALYARDLVKSERKDGALNIVCPRASEHSSESGASATIYFPPNTGGFARGNFSCRHAHCVDREQRDFREALGLGDSSNTADGFEDISPRDEQRRQRQQAENAKLQESDISVMPTILTVAEMEAVCVWISEGSQVGLIDDPRQVLSYVDFAGLTAASATEIKDQPKKLDGEPKVREVPNAVIWKKSPVRKTVATRTFHPGAPRISHDPDGKVALNSWRQIERWPAQRDVGLFVGQATYLFPDPVEREAFLDWLAHIEQHPGELPHYGWLHIATNTGTGRNWLASLLARLWRGQVAPNVDLPALLDSQFNGQLAGRIIAIVDEVQEGAGENPHRNANRLKSIVNAEFRELNPKYGRQYREHNSLRWLIFSNHYNALPLSDNDRRFRVACHSAPPRPPADYATLYRALADAEFVNAVGVYLRDRDISGFNPGARPPMSEAKLAAVSASKSLIVKYAEDLVANWPSAVATNRDVAKVLSDGVDGATFTNAMRRALEELDCESIAKPLKVNGVATRCWMLRDAERWRDKAPAELVAEVYRGQRQPPEEDGRGADDLFSN